MKVWFYRAYGPYVGCETTGIVLAEDEKEACDDVYTIAVENYDSYAHFEDEDDIEREYDYYVEEYDSEEHDHKLFPSDVEQAQAFLKQLNPHQA